MIHQKVKMNKSEKKWYESAVTQAPIAIGIKKTNCFRLYSFNNGLLQPFPETKYKNISPEISKLQQQLLIKVAVAVAYKGK